ncbi:MAG TPA: response regulator transcription factor [Flavipsychrobacter sp.]
MKKSPIYIAIADDHAIFRKGVITQLQPYKHLQFILEATEGQELIEQLSSAQQLPDICILDISMKPMNGYETANAIRDKWPKMKTIALTMLDDEYCIINMLRNGARGYITKGQDTATLLKAIEQVYTHGFYHDDIDGEILSKALQGDSVYPQLTDREHEFLYYCCSDLSYREIGDKMNASTRTVEGYRDSLCKKFNAKTRTGLVSFALFTGLVTDRVLA